MDKTLHGVCRSPKHWFTMIIKILEDMGLQVLSHDHCLYAGIINIPDESSLSVHQETHIGLHVDNFVFFSTD